MWFYYNLCETVDVGSMSNTGKTMAAEIKSIYLTFQPSTVPPCRLNFVVRLTARRQLNLPIQVQIRRT